MIYLTAHGKEKEAEKGVVARKEEEERRGMRVGE